MRNMVSRKPTRELKDSERQGLPLQGELGVEVQAVPVHAVVLQKIVISAVQVEI